MERLTHAWAEMSIAGVTLSRVGMSRMISALQFKYSTKKKMGENWSYQAKSVTRVKFLDAQSHL